jgi:ligand-binding SRPBCC domain-containing protein
MIQRSFEIDTFINASPEAVRNFLAKLENHQKIHPLIIAVKHDNTTTASDGVPIQHYHITDRMKLGPSTLQFTYRVTNRVNPAAVTELVFEAFQFPRIHLSNTMSFHLEGDGTRLRERVIINAPRILLGTVYKQALQSHRESFAKLATLFGSTKGEDERIIW